MKRKFLEALGLEKDMIDKIMTENGADIELMKTESANLKKQLEDQNLQLEELNKSSVDQAVLQKQFDDLQTEHTAARETYESEVKELKLASAIKQALGDSARDADLVAGLLDKSKLVFSDAGKVTGLEEQMRLLKKEKAFLFKEERPQIQIRGGKPVESAGTPSACRRPSEMSYSELCKYLETNPGAAMV